ncbi:hypothetical protein C731_4267 [Mycolicibacterium hassiacum DSM 44199]|uniref:Uncharacterized protein n=1 Tax=Mycolicibacterium hassiacum (strain DSM 44199 / CIP 105218 / JCM 12690 / 3849) TaxID=1122247 RepID=K5B7E0_MYCHD|nr:hypothetical protein C731_4267 [Mycolicibacterium hassiacum DSM 44199]
MPRTTAEVIHDSHGATHPLLELHRTRIRYPVVRDCKSDHPQISVAVAARNLRDCLAEVTLDVAEPHPKAPCSWSCA